MSEGWLSWAMKNATPERVTSAMGYMKENVPEEDLQKLANSAVVKDIKDAITDEIKTEIPAGTAPSGSLTSKWTSWMRSKADAAPPAPPPTTSRQKYLRLAVKNWKYTMPVASEFRVL